MKKLNTTYLDNLVSKILKETLEERADTLVSKIKGGMCEQCGGKMNEGKCDECGGKYEEMEEGIYDVSGKFPKHQSFDYVEETEDFEDEGDFGGEESTNNEDNEITCRKHIEMFGEDDEVTQKLCQGINITESLRGRKRRQSRKSETDEGNAFTGALSQARKTGDEDFEVDGKKFETKEGKKFPDLTGDGKVTRKDVLVGRGVKLKSAEPKKNVKESFKLSENEMVSLIEKIVLEQNEKNIKTIGGTPKGLEKYKQVHTQDGKQNDEYIKSVTKKMKDYLKDGSNGEYSMEPKIFPKGNGELEKMSKKAYTMSDAGKEFIDDFMSPGMENLDYDQIEPNEEQITNNIEGASKTGNNPKWGNAVETDVNKKINAKRKANKFAKVRNMAYQKSAQPIKDATGEDSGKGINLKLESEDKKTKQINEEFQKIKQLISYDRKTQ